MISSIDLVECTFMDLSNRLIKPDNTFPGPTSIMSDILFDLNFSRVYNHLTGEQTC